MKRIVLFVFLIIALSVANTKAQTVFQSGDLVFVAYRMNATATEDEIAVLSLVNILPNTQIRFTDAKYTSNPIAQCAGGFTWTAPATGLASGSVIRIQTSALTASVGNVAGSGFGLSSGGDQVIVYTGTEAAPTYITALSSNAWLASNTSCSGSNSQLPAGLIDGTSSINLSTAADNVGGNTVNAYYNGSTSFSAAQLRANILNPLNWVGVGSATPPQAWPSWSFPGPPSVVSAKVLNTTSIQVIFSTNMNVASATNSANYTGISGLSSITLTNNGSLADTAILSFGAPFLSGTAYSLAIAGIEDSEARLMYGTYNFNFNYNTTIAWDKKFYTLNESASSVTLKLKVNFPSTSSVDLVVKTAPFSTASTSDFTFLSQTISLDGNTSGEYLITIPVINDMDKEDDEYFVLSLENAAGLAITGSASTTVYIKDNDRTAPVPSKEISLNYTGSFDPSPTSSSSAEIVSYDPTSKRLFIISAIQNRLDIADFTNPAAISLISSVDMTPYGGITSIAVKNGIVAAASPNANDQLDGSVVLFNTDGVFQKQLSVGTLPDMVTFSPDGSKIMTANEGQPNDAYTIDPEGSVSIIDFSGGILNVNQSNVTTLYFTDFNAQESALISTGIRKTKSTSTLSQDFEPEYITIAANGQKAWVSLQENNAMAEINLSTKTITSVWALGTKNYADAGNGFDASDKSGTPLLANFNIKAFFMPDGIGTYQMGGVNYVVTANEGDEKEYAGLNERTTVGASSTILDPTIYPNAAVLKEEPNLGRLRMTNLNGDTDGDGDYDQIYVNGSRSFSIFNADSKSLVYDSKNDFEVFTSVNPTTASIFNADNTDNALKGRSRAKGPEPEGMLIRKIAGKMYAFIGLERMGGVMIYNVTDPANPVFVDYNNSRSLTTYGGDLGPEGIEFIDASDSPDGKYYLAIANEISGTVSVYELSVYGETGPSTASTPYLCPIGPGAAFTSIFTANDSVNGYTLCGLADGLGAFDNGDTTFTLLVNHEMGNTVGVIRDHGSKGGFVSKWTINKSDMSVISGADLIQNINIWNGTAYTTHNAGNPSTAAAMNRLCSADLPIVSAFYNSATGNGTQERIFMNGEEAGTEGRAFGHIATGPNSGTSYELPYLGKFSWENSVASPTEGEKTVVAGLDDVTGGQLYFYVGTKTNSGNEIDKAGLSNGKLFGVAVNGIPTETVTDFPGANTPFTLVDLGSVQNTSGATLQTASVTAGVTSFLRPEDGHWDPSNLSDFYFVTTASFTGPSRLFKVHFTDPSNPELGGTISTLLDGTEGQKMMDNMTIDKFGHALIQEDPGNQAHVAKIWQYTIATDELKMIAQHDPNRFVSGGSKFLTQDEESSGIIDMSEILGPGMFMIADQAHYAVPGEAVEGGQLLAYFNPDTYKSYTGSGPSTAYTPYLEPISSGVELNSVLTATETAGGYTLCGLADGLGAFDNGDNTFTLLVNHEMGNTVGVTRDHGSKGGFVSKWTINKSDMTVISGADLIQNINIWNGASYDTYNASNPSTAAAMNRLCSADLPLVSAFYNSATGNGTQERIFMNGEEAGTEGRAFGHIATGPNTGTSYELPYLGKFSWENSVASPTEGEKTVVAGLDDVTGGQLYFYVGTKTNSGNEIEKAGLSNGKLFGVAVAGIPTETVTEFPAANTPFTLVDLGSVQNTSGATLQTTSVSAGVTSFLRPEDGHWDPSNLSDFYFVTTASFTGPSRLFKVHFTDPSNPELGGTISTLLDGTEGQKMMDNMTIDNFGHALIQEDPGNQAHLGKIWQYTIATDELKLIGQHDPNRFLAGNPGYLTQDEESSGVIDMQEILGPGMFLLTSQAHYAIPGAVVEGGQLLTLFNKDTYDAFQVSHPITGVLSYDNSVLSPISNTEVRLLQGTNQIRKTKTDAQGNFNFPYIAPGSYSLVASPSKPWGGSNATDALIVIKQFVETTSLSALRLKAADVNNSVYVNASDALWIAKRFVNLTSSFLINDWVSETPAVQMTGTGPVNQNFSVICAGDVDGSYIPSAKTAPTVSLQNSGVISIPSNHELALPVISAQDMEVGAMSLVLEIPGNFGQITDVMNAHEGNLVYNISGNELRIAWYELNPMVVNAGDVLFTLNIQVNPTMDPAQLNWAVNPISSFSNAEGTEISSVQLAIPQLLKNNSGFMMSQNSPNPFGQTSLISYYLPEEGNVSIKVLDLTGRVVLNLTEQVQEAGAHNCTIDASTLPTGVYFYHLAVSGKTQNYTETKRMMVSK